MVQVSQGAFIHKQPFVVGRGKSTMQVSLSFSVLLYIIWVSFHICTWWLMRWFYCKTGIGSNPSWLFISAMAQSQCENLMRSFKHNTLVSVGAQ